MWKIFKNKIDRLKQTNKELELKKEKIENRKDEKNSTIETQIKKLENLAWRKKQIAEVKIAMIDRQINKNKDLIATEKKYYLEDEEDE